MLFQLKITIYIYWNCEHNEHLPNLSAMVKTATKLSIQPLESFETLAQNLGMELSRKSLPSDTIYGKVQKKTFSSLKDWALNSAFYLFLNVLDKRSKGEVVTHPCS